MTKDKYKELFDEDFKRLCRILKDKGVYAYVMKYLFSRDNKNKEDLFNVFLRYIDSNRFMLNNGSIRRILNNIGFLGFVTTPFRHEYAVNWYNNYRWIYLYLEDYDKVPEGTFVTDGVMIEIDD